MEPVFHYFIPLFALFAFFPNLVKKIGYKTLILLGFIAVLPDLDTLFFGCHRFLFHNLFFMAGVVLICYLINHKYALISFYFLFSHFLFDLSKPGIAFLYPITDKLAYLDIIISSANKYFLSIDFGILNPNAIDPNWPCNYLQPWGALTLILIAILGFIAYYPRIRALVQPCKLP